MIQYRKIALASTFSPRFLPLLAEAKRVVRDLHCDFSLIHVGERSEEAERQFAAAFEKLGLHPHPHIHWAAGGGDPAAAIQAVIEEEEIDLLMAGALEKETPGRHYVGNVARTLLRNARCSLLLFTTPSAEPQPFRRIVTITDYSELSMKCLRQAYFLASQNETERIHVVRIFTIFAQVHAQPAEFFGREDARSSLLEAEERHVTEFAEAAGSSPAPLEIACVEGTTGFAVSDYVQAMNADLLVIPAQPPGTAQLLPDGMDWVFNVIPSNLLIVRESPHGA